MARRPHRRHRRKGAKRPEAEPHPYADPARPIPNLACADRFEHYYRAQNLVADGREWSQLISTLHRPLPVCFRLCSAGVHARAVSECLASGADLLAGRGAIPAALELPWCRGYTVHVSKEELKAARLPEHAAMQRWLSYYSSLGVLTRQAIESMVPVALLKPQGQHRVLDMCASPGSKTTQALEAIWADGDPAAAGGFVVANDSVRSRCSMLLRRCAALGECAKVLMVVTHKAQCLPPLPCALSAGSERSESELSGSERGGGSSLESYDRIVCDVPCSGDGTTRKNPSVWHRWSQEFALEMHPLQLQIAMRGVALLKVGGLIAYSTCSLNPIENESVVAELLRRCGDALELVDARDRIPDLKRAQGLHSWVVMDDELNRYESYEALMSSSMPAALKRRWQPSMWPPSTQGKRKHGPASAPPPLERCLRMLPHLADMGGFFVALLRKVKPLPGKPSSAVLAQSPVAQGTARLAPTPTPALSPAPIPAPIPALATAVNGGAYLQLPREMLKSMRRQLQLRKSMQELAPQLLCRSETAPVVSYVAAPLREVLDNNRSPRGGLRIFCAGFRLARRSRRGAFQLTAEGASALAPHIKKANTVRPSKADAKLLLQRLGTRDKSSGFVALSELSAKAQAAARRLRPGACLLSFRAAARSGSGDRHRLIAPARRVQKPEGIRLLLPYMAGLEFRPAAIAHTITASMEAS